VKRARLRLCPLVCGLALACGTDLGIGGGAKTSGNIVGFGRLAASTRLSPPWNPNGPMNERGPLVGIDLEDRAEQNIGSRWQAGVFAGWGAGPAPFGEAFAQRFGWEAYGEFGFPLHSTLFASTDLYAGVGLAAPFRLDATRKVSDLNETTWVLKRRVELVPLFRTRYLFGPPAQNHFHRLEITGGLAFRFRLETDLF
jgi:hypothetical protein